MTHSWFFPHSFIARESTTSILLRYSHIAIEVKAIEKKREMSNNRATTDSADETQENVIGVSIDEYFD